MYHYTSRQQTYNLFSNFLTNSYFDLLDKWRHYELASTSHRASAYNELVKATHSFLFLAQASKYSTQQLQQQIFDNLPPKHISGKYDLFKELTLSYPQGVSLLHLSKTKLNLKQLKKCYLQLFHRPTLTNTLENDDHNKVFVSLYHFIHTELLNSVKSKPLILDISSAEGFITSVCEFRIKDLLNKGQLDKAHALSIFQETQIQNGSMQKSLSI